MNDGRKIQRDEAVSETIGFLIVFGIALTGIALVTMYGYPALMQEQANANIKNMQKNMIVLRNDITGLAFKNTPYQETNIVVSGGTLYVKGQPGATPNFIITNGPNSTSFYPGEIWYESVEGQATVALENGAVHVRYWSSPSGSAMLSKPRWFYDNGTYVIDMIRVNASSDMSNTGIGTVKMIRVDPSPPIIWTIDNTSPTRIQYNHNIERSYKVAWSNYFSEPELHMTPSGSGYLMNDPAAKTLIIKQYNLTVLSI